MFTYITTKHIHPLNQTVTHSQEFLNLNVKLSDNLRAKQEERKIKQKNKNQTELQRHSNSLFVFGFR